MFKNHIYGILFEFVTNNTHTDTHTDVFVTTIIFGHLHKYFKYINILMNTQIEISIYNDLKMYSFGRSEVFVINKPRVATHAQAAGDRALVVISRADLMETLQLSIFRPITESCWNFWYWKG